MLLLAANIESNFDHIKLKVDVVWCGSRSTIDALNRILPCVAAEVFPNRMLNDVDVGDSTGFSDDVIRYDDVIGGVKVLCSTDALTLLALTMPSSP